MKANTYRILYALFGVALALQIVVATLSLRDEAVGHQHNGWRTPIGLWRS